jgi:CRP/FNR family transcriptional regulator
MAILDNKPRSANAIAEGDVTVFAVNKENFQAMVTKQPQLATKLITLLAERIWLIYRQLANILIKEPQGRLYDTLFTQILKHRIEPKKGLGFTFDFSVSDLLKMTGLDPVNDRKLADTIFQGNNKFRINEDGKIFCNDVEEIQKMVNYYKKIEQLEKKREKQKKLYGRR